MNEKTDTCQDCSNHPCDCGMPAGYAPTPRTDNSGRYCSHQRRERWIKTVPLKTSEELERELAAVTEQLKETQEALAAEIKHHTETTAKWNGHHMDLTITQCDLNTAHRTLKEVTEQRDRLAEALRKITEYDLGDIPIGVVRKCNEALQTLNQTTREI